MSIKVVDAKDHLGVGSTFQRFKAVRELDERISNFTPPHLEMTKEQQKMVENFAPFVDGQVHDPLHSYLELHKGPKPRAILLALNEQSSEVDGVLIVDPPQEGIAHASYLGTARFSDVAVTVDSLVQRALGTISPNRLACKGRIDALQDVLGYGSKEDDLLYLSLPAENDGLISPVANSMASTIPCSPTGMYSPVRFLGTPMSFKEPHA